MSSQAEVLTVVTSNPGLSANEISKILGCPKKKVYMRLNQLRKYGLVTRLPVAYEYTEIYHWYATESLCTKKGGDL